MYTICRWSSISNKAVSFGRAGRRHSRVASGQTKGILAKNGMSRDGRRNCKFGRVQAIHSKNRKLFDTKEHMCQAVQMLKILE